MSKPELLEPKVWFRKSLPYPKENYTVVSYASLHPDLKRQVGNIKDQTKASRWATACYFLLITPIGRIAQLPRVLKFFGPSLAEAFPWLTRAFPGWFRGYYSMRGERKTTEGRLRRFVNGLGVSLTNFAFPYLVPKLKTKIFGQRIQELNSKNTAPFLRKDWKRLVEEHDEGFVDNAGNVVLLKHPDNPLAKKVSEQERQRLLRAWNQRFQRTRFSLKP